MCDLDKPTGRNTSVSPKCVINGKQLLCTIFGKQDTTSRRQFFDAGLDIGTGNAVHRAHILHTTSLVGLIYTIHNRTMGKCINLILKQAPTIIAQIISIGKIHELFQGKMGAFHL